MIKELLGTGTMYYGKSKKGLDKSYIATKWITIFYLPLFPLGSYRVWSKKKFWANNLNRDSIRVSLNVRQVVIAYLLLLLALSLALSFHSFLSLAFQLVMSTMLSY